MVSIVINLGGMILLKCILGKWEKGCVCDLPSSREALVAGLVNTTMNVGGFHKTREML